MKILLLDTVGRPNLVAFGDTTTETVTEEVWQADGDEAERILPAVEQVLQEERPDAIVCVNGPGRFTSTRIGVAVANALSMAWRIPAIGIDHLTFVRRLMPDGQAEAIAVPSEKESEYYFALADGSNIQLASSHATLSAECQIIEQEQFGSLWKDGKDRFFIQIAGILDDTEKQVPIAPFYMRAPNITTMKKL